MHIVWHWFTMGPYHFARMAAVGRQRGVQLTVIETTSLDDHGWKRDQIDVPFRLITMAQQELNREVHVQTRSQYGRLLEELKPDIVVESGYAEPFSRNAAVWYRRRRTDMPLVLWSETTGFDHRRQPLREFVKGLMLNAFDGAITAGQAHADYLVQLGMEPGRTAVVGNTVDNDAFAEGSRRARRAGPPADLSRPYFVYVGRFIEFKNLPFLIRAHARYRQQTQRPPLDLVLVGSGPGEPAIRAQLAAGGSTSVHLAGNKQIDELFTYYAHAAAFVLPSTSEPWGLVVNEAMAAGLPVLASNKCGCAGELVIPDETGYQFDPANEEELAALFERMADPVLRARLAVGASARVAYLAPEPYAQRVVRHLEHLRAQHHAGSGWRRNAATMAMTLEEAVS